jgi:hypothetical protein
LFLCGALARTASAQQQQQQPQQQEASSPATTTKTTQQDAAARSSARSDDLSVTANVTARELRFEVVPEPKGLFTGKPERSTLWKAERHNLPRPVEPGVTY